MLEPALKDRQICTSKIVSWVWPQVLVVMTAPRCVLPAVSSVRASWLVAQGKWTPTILLPGRTVRSPVGRASCSQWASLEALAGGTPHLPLRKSRKPRRILTAQICFWPYGAVLIEELAWQTTGYDALTLRDLLGWWRVYPWQNARQAYAERSAIGHLSQGLCGIPKWPIVYLACLVEFNPDWLPLQASLNWWEDLNPFGRAGSEGRSRVCENLWWTVQRPPYLRCCH